MIKAIKHSWLTVIMLVVVCIGLFIGYTKLYVEDQYESEYIIQTSLQYKTINKVVKSPSTCKAIDNQTGQAFGTTKNSLKINKEGNKITILVTTNEAILSKKIADGVIVTLQNEYPNKIAIIQAAKVNTNPSQKNLILNILKGCVLGMFLGDLYILATYFYNLHK